MAHLVSEPRVLPRPAAVAARSDSLFGGLARRRVLARGAPWPAPRLRLAPRVTPRCRLELALCELFRCQPCWSAAALVARLARAPAGSERAVPSLDYGKPLGRRAARAMLRRWLAEGQLVPVDG